MKRAGGRRRFAKPSQRPRLFFDRRPEVIYAVGDVHGCYDLLVRMEEQIAENAVHLQGEKWIVLLGDYVDRGPRSRDVLDYLLRSPPDGFTRLCLAGNHEELMLSYLSDPEPGHIWLQLGGRETLISYGIHEIANRPSMHPAVKDGVPSEHLEFLRKAPSLLSVPGFVFVHGGLRRGVPLERQSEDDLLWLRPQEGDGPVSSDFLLVHGHTPVPAIEVGQGRINVDTGAYKSGVLSCVRIQREGRISRFALR